MENTWGYEDGRTTLEIGRLTKDEIVAQLKERDISISPFAQELLDSPKFAVAEQQEEIELVVRTPADLGLSDGATTEQIYEAARKQGLELCPPETGPLLRLRADTEARLGHYLIIAMEQITDSYGLPVVFALARDDGLSWLRAPRAGPVARWGASSPFVFRRSKASSGS